MWTKRHAREKAMWWWRHRVTDAATSLRRPKTASNYQRLGESTVFPHSQQKQPILLTPWLWTSGLKNCRENDFPLFSVTQTKTKLVLLSVLPSYTEIHCVLPHLALTSRFSSTWREPRGSSLVSFGTVPTADPSLAGSVFLPQRAASPFLLGSTFRLWLQKSSEGAEWAQKGSPVWAGTFLNCDAGSSTELGLWWWPLGVWGVSR